MVWFAIVSLLAAVVALTTACWLVNQQAIRAHNDAKEIAKAGIEASSRYGAMVLQTASAIRTNIDQAVAARVKFINGLTAPQTPGAPPPDPVEEAPMRTTGMVDEVHEIARDLTRLQRDTGDPVREAGVGNEEPPGFGTPMEI